MTHALGIAFEICLVTFSSPGSAAACGLRSSSSGSARSRRNAASRGWRRARSVLNGRRCVTAWDLGGAPKLRLLEGGQRDVRTPSDEATPGANERRSGLIEWWAV